MSRLVRPLLAGFSLVLLASQSHAHYPMLLPDKPSVKTGQEVTLTLLWGHPFEHQLFDAPPPDSVYVMLPDGKKVDLDKEAKKIGVMEGKKEVSAYRLTYKPEKRGDYVFVVKNPNQWMADEEESWQDTVKVVVHVQAQKGWDGPGNLDFDMTALTRPYGLQAGMVFQASVWTPQRVAQPVPGRIAPFTSTVRGGMGGLLVEIERFNATAPKELPPDEQITRSAKTDPNGVVTCTLTEPGWWCLAAQREGAMQKHAGKSYPAKQRIIHWVYVDEKPVSKTKGE